MRDTKGDHLVNGCNHYLKDSCVHGALRVSPGTCAVCPKYADSGTLQPVRVVRKVVAVPRDQWPLWTKAIEKLRTAEDVGVGSTIDRLLGKFGKVYKVTLKAMGVPCGCNARKAEWNTKFPY